MSVPKYPAFLESDAALAQRLGQPLQVGDASAAAAAAVDVTFDKRLHATPEFYVAVAHGKAESFTVLSFSNLKLSFYAIRMMNTHIDNMRGDDFVAPTTMADARAWLSMRVDDRAARDRMTDAQVAFVWLRLFHEDWIREHATVTEEGATLVDLGAALNSLLHNYSL